MAPVLRDFGLVTVADLLVALAGVMLVLPAAVVWAEEGFPLPARARATRVAPSESALVGRPLPHGERRRTRRLRKGPAERPRRTTIYSLIVGLAFIALIAVAGINTISTKNKGVLGATNEGDLPLAQFAVPDARTGAERRREHRPGRLRRGAHPLSVRRARGRPPARSSVPGAIRVCDLFDKPLVLSFWFTRGGDCEDQEDVFERAYRALLRTRSTSSRSTSATAPRRSAS